jgi:putative aldouronate transport system permease protein
MSVRTKHSVGSITFDVFNHLFLILLGLATLGPFLYLIFGSLTQADYYRTVGVSILPTHWTWDSYRVLLGSSSRVYQALKVTLFITIVGTLFSLLSTAALAYGISKRDLPGHKIFTFLVFFTMMFGGGMVPFYLVVKGLKMVDTLWSLIVPFMVNAWYMFIMVQFFRSLPKELEDAARIDGCNELTIFARIVLPLSMPVMATVGLFYAVGYWNQWFWATIFLTEDQLLPLQLVLRDILSQMLHITDPEAAVEQAKMLAGEMPPVEVLRMGAIIVTVLPITLVYPFLQRYFVKGVMIGAVKG